MKKYMLAPIGFKKPTKTIMQAWGQWFTDIKDSIVDPGAHFASGKEITQAGISTLKLDLHAMTGYIIIQAKNMKSAEKISQQCPMITGIKIFEMMSMCE